VSQPCFLGGNAGQTAQFLADCKYRIGKGWPETCCAMHALLQEQSLIEHRSAKR